ncbi:MAG: NUDIX hydrolase [Bacteroidales bacterium]
MRVDTFDIFIEKLRQSFLTPDKPGAIVQETMAPTYKKFIPIKQPLVEAAVLVLFYPINNLPHFVLIKRTPDDFSPHGGQVSLPGGRYENSDKDYLYTALRETSEEVGISISSITVLGALTPLIVPVSGFHVHPFVGYLFNSPQWSINSHEVSYLIEVPLSELTNPNNVNSETILFEGNNHQIPYFRLVGEKVWGATAMILAELKAIVQRAL